MNFLCDKLTFGAKKSSSARDCVTLYVFEGRSKFLGIKKFLALGTDAILDILRLFDNLFLMFYINGDDVLT